jgi:hypothetical protein
VVLGNVVLQQAIVRPDHLGRTHPDPRADPPTVVLDPSRAPTEELQQVGPDTHRIPALGADGAAADPDSEADTAGIPIVEPGDGAAAQNVFEKRGAGRPGQPGPAGSPAAAAHVCASQTHSHGHGLALSALLGSAGGLVGWLVAAHLVPVAALGDAQLVVSLLQLIGGLAPLTILPMRRWQPGRLVWMATLLVMPLAAIVGLGCGVLVPRLGAVATGQGAAPITGLLLVALGCAGWGLLSAYDILVAAAGRPRWAVWRSALFAPAQIGALVALCGVAGLGAYGVVLSWLGPIAVWMVLGVAIVPVLVRRTRAQAASGVPDAPFGAPAAISLVGTALLYHLVPIVVTVRFGPETGAVFFVAWQVFVVVDLAAAYTVHALSGAVAREPHRTAQLVARARRRLLIVFLPVIALGAALAGPLLTAFGTAYAEAGDMLRLLLLGLAFRLVVTHELGVRQALGHGVGFDRLQLFSAVLVLVVAIALPVTAAGVTELRLVAIGYIVVQVACAAAVLVIPAARRTDVEVRAP